MDDHSFGLVDALVTSRVGTLGGDAPPSGPARGKTLHPLIQDLVDWACVQQAQVARDLPTADAAGRQAHARQLFRALLALDVAEGISSYKGDVGRKDVQVGLLCLIDVLIADLLPPDSDPLVHLDPAHNYSTLSLGAGISTFIGRTPTVANPIVFNLPAADPANILYSPILAHEVGHPVVNTGSLIDTIFQLGDRARVDALLAQQLQAQGIANHKPWVERLRSWLAELLCDAIAASLTGPSWLYSIAAFLPAPRPGELDTHPYAADRLALAVEHLGSMGWRPTLESSTPAILAWLDQLSTSPVLSHDPEETFLRGAIEILRPQILAVAKDNVGRPLDSSEYARVAPELVELMDAGIPPCQLRSGEVPSAWQLVLAGWQVALSRLGDDAKNLGIAAEDRPFNAYLVKSVELTRVAELWKNA